MRAWFLAATFAVVLLSVTAMPAAGQASGPRTRDGKPDLSGVWQVVNSAHWDIQGHNAQLFPGLSARFGMPAGQSVVEGNEIPYQPWAFKKKQENYANRETADPEAKCFLPGVPRITYMPYPFQIFQTPKQITIAYEYLHAVRNLSLIHI